MKMKTSEILKEIRNLTRAEQARIVERVVRDYARRYWGDNAEEKTDVRAG